jgi:hypothetical protein
MPYAKNLIALVARINCLLIFSHARNAGMTA